MIGVMATGQLGQAAQAQVLPPQTEPKPAQAQILPPQTEPEPVQAQVPPWTLHTSFSVTEQYNDNVFLSTGPNDPNGPERSDTVTILSPELTISHKTGRVTFTAQYQPSFNLYTKYHSELNYIGQSGRATLGVIGLGPGVLQYSKLDVSEAFVYTEESLYNYPLAGGVTGNGGIVTQRSKSWSNEATVSLTQQLTTTLQGIAMYDSHLYRYENPSLTDTDENMLSLTVSDRWTEHTTMSATYSYTDFSYDVANTTRQVTNTISFGITHAVSPTLQTHVSVGDTYLSTNNRQYLTGAASVSKQFHYTTATVTYAYEPTAGGGISLEPTFNESGSCLLTRTLGPHAHASVSGDFTDQRTTTTPVAVTQSFTVAASVNYEVTKWLGAAVSYRHVAQQGNNTAAGQDLRWNTIGLTLGGTWETPIP